MKSPVSPSPLGYRSPLGQATHLDRPPPQIPDHELLQPIGYGAYGQVWLARSVMGTLRAVKAVYRQDFADSQPFDREFKGIQKFEPVSRSHAGLVNILQIGRNEAAGYFYYVMELADESNAECRVQKAEASGEKPSGGETEHGRDEKPSSPVATRMLPHSALSTPHLYTPHTLRHDLRSRGRLTFEECLQLGLSLTSALEHLHQHGLVHRDIKPSNIIFVNRQSKLADIGLVTGIDEAHSLVGTVGYLSPDGAGTPQGDLYSLGKVLYEAAFGKQASEFPQLPADLPSRPDHRRLLDLNEIIATACASHAEDRYHSAGQMHEDLARLQRGRSIRSRRTLEHAGRLAMRTFPLALVLAALGILVFNLSLKKGPPASVPPDTASIFVLPFRPAWAPEPQGTNGEPRALRDNFHERVTDALIDSLALLKGVRTGPRRLGWIARDEAECRREASKSFAYVLAGTLTNPPGLLEAKVTLYQSRPERLLWSETFAGSTNDVIAMQRRIIDRVARSLGLLPTPQEVGRIEQQLTNNLAAYREWCAAMEIVETRWGRTDRDALMESMGRAVSLDPKYIGAHLLKVLYYSEHAFGEQRPSLMWQLLKNECEYILTIDDTCYDAQRGLLDYRIFYDWDWDYLKTELDRHRRLFPDSHALPAVWYRCLGRTNEARLEQAQWEQQEPNICWLRFHGPGARFFERDYAGALKEARRWPRMIWDNYYWEARCLIEMGDYPRALEAIENARQSYSFNVSELLGLQGRAYARMGEREKALEVLQELKRRGSDGYVEPYFVASVHAALEQSDLAFEWLERAVQDRSGFLVHPDRGGLRNDPAWDGIRDDPRFHAILKQVRLDIWPK